jgi:tetratricopeptide (TPR) repeat protein
MFSDALLEALSPEECEAVLAHEIAHSRFKHPVIYLLFTLGFVALAYDFMAMLPPMLQSDYLVGMPILAVLVVVYFRFLFGYLSRAFERQADVYAAGLVGTPVPLILALEKIALMSGDIRELRSWRHHSVNERVRFLGEIGYDAEAQRRYHSSMTRLWGLVAMSVVLFSAWGGYVWTQEPEGIAVRIKSFEDVVAKNPAKYHVWRRLGDLEAERGNTEAALRNYGEALRNKPKCEEALSGLSSLDVPEDAKKRTLALAYADAGFGVEARAEAEAAVGIDPTNAANHATLARVLIAIGEMASARHALAEVRRLDPENLDLPVLLERIDKKDEEAGGAGG